MIHKSMSSLLESVFRLLRHLQDPSSTWLIDWLLWLSSINPQEMIVLFKISIRGLKLTASWSKSLCPVMNLFSVQWPLSDYRSGKLHSMTLFASSSSSPWDNNFIAHFSPWGFIAIKYYYQVDIYTLHLHHKQKSWDIQGTCVKGKQWGSIIGQVVVTLCDYWW